jgi:hypothetical protein
MYLSKLQSNKTWLSFLLPVSGHCCQFWRNRRRPTQYYFLYSNLGFNPILFLQEVFLKTQKQTETWVPKHDHFNATSRGSDTCMFKSLLFLLCLAGRGGMRTGVQTEPYDSYIESLYLWTTPGLLCVFFSLVFFFFVGPGFELRAPCLQNTQSPVWVTLTAYFALVILEMGVSRSICLGEPPNASIPSSWDYRCEPLVPSLV